MNKKNFFAALVAALIFFNVILSANVLAWGGPELDKDGYYTLKEGYYDADYSIVDREYDLVRLVKKDNGTYKYSNYGETVRLKTLSLDRGSWLNKNYNKPEKIIIPEGVEAIMYGSFENKGLTDVKFPNSLQYIGSSAFKGNKISGKISLPNVWKVDSYAFEGNKITDIDAPKLELIDTNAFQNNMIEGEVNLPELKAISWYGLADNKEITLIAPKLEVVGKEAFLNTTVKKAELPKLKLVEGQGGAGNIKEYYTTKQFTVEWKAEGEAKLPEQKPVVKVHLYANGEQKENYVIVSNGAETAEFKDLPTYYIDQTEFNYTAKEAFNDLIIQEGKTFEYELKGVKYTFKVNYVGDKIINTVVKSEDQKEEAKKALLQEKEKAKAKIDLLDELSGAEKEEVKKQIAKAEDKEAIDQIVKKAEEKNTEAGKNKVDAERLKKAKKALAAYMKSFDENLVDNPAIEYQDENVKGDIKKAIKRAKDLLAKDDINQEELEEMEKIPYKKVDGKKSGLFRDFTKKALVNFEVLGDKDQVNPHNGKKYTSLKNNIIKIKSSLKGAGKIGENDKFFFKLNYVKEEDFKPENQATGLDATSTPTPKYKKQEMPKDDYEVKSVEGGYEIKINKLPADVKIIKPIVLAKLADNTYFENGTLVFVSAKEDPKQPEEPKKPHVPDYSGGIYYEPTPRYNYNPVVEAKAPKKEAKKEEKAESKKEVKSEPVVITSKFTLDSMNFGVNDSINTMDVAPFAKNGRIMVPIRFVGMALGFDVSWDDATKTAILKDDKTEIRIPMKGKTFYVNGVAYEADAEPEIRSERIFLSISNIAKALGLEEGKTIFWDQQTKTASFIFNK